MDAEENFKGFVYLMGANGELPKNATLHAERRGSRPDCP
jgi:hypothetical protein